MRRSQIRELHRQQAPHEELVMRLMWFDNAEDRTPADKLVRAIQHYTEKSFPGQHPTICLVPARDHWWKEDMINGIKIVLSPGMIISGSFMLAQAVMDDHPVGEEP
ncbi:MAG: hypothetical protein L0Z53_15070 [Acidobacteriales bacterium]|nr:hypothetical protein [Terriglobales bacterium]